MLPTVCFIAVVLAYLAGLGRSATPRAERLPVAQWRASDLFFNVLGGARSLVDLHRRNPLASHHRLP